MESTTLRHNLTYAQAKANAQRVGMEAYDATLAKGGSIDEAEAACFHAYNDEMKWYENKQ